MIPSSNISSFMEKTHGSHTPEPSSPQNLTSIPRNQSAPILNQANGQSKWLFDSQSLRPPFVGDSPTLCIPGRLPVPFAAMHAAQQANLTPTSSEPVSEKSSRGPSPLQTPQYDALEGGSNLTFNGFPGPASVDKVSIPQHPIPYQMPSQQAMTNLALPNGAMSSSSFHSQVINGTSRASIISSTDHSSARPSPIFYSNQNAKAENLEPINSSTMACHDTQLVPSSLSQPPTTSCSNQQSGSNQFLITPENMLQQSEQLQSEILQGQGATRQILSGRQSGPRFAGQLSAAQIPGIYTPLVQAPLVGQRNTQLQGHSSALESRLPFISNHNSGELPGKPGVMSHDQSSSNANQRPGPPMSGAGQQPVPLISESGQQPGTPSLPGLGQQGPPMSVTRPPMPGQPTGPPLSGQLPRPFPVSGHKSNPLMSGQQPGSLSMSDQQPGLPPIEQQHGDLRTGQQIGHPPMPGQQAGPPMSGQQTGPPMSGQQTGPPMSGQQTGPPMSGQHTGPPMSGQHTGPPMPGQHTGPPMPGQHAGPPMPGQHARPPMPGQHAGPPSGQHAGPPSGQHAGPPSGQYSGPPQQMAHTLVGQQPKPGWMTGTSTTNQIDPTDLSKFTNMKLDNNRSIDLLQAPSTLTSLKQIKPNLGSEELSKFNCSTDVFCCTLTAMPNSPALLKKSRLPLGILIHPFKDLSQLPVIQSTIIVRCRTCRTYINPFVTFCDNRRWKCNLCHRVNDLPEEFSYDPVSKTYGEPQRRPEIKSSTIEFVAPSEYMLRPPQPSVYLFLLDVSVNAISTGYLSLFTSIFHEELDDLPGNERTQIGFITYSDEIHFYNLAEGLSQPQKLVVSDIDDVFLPCPDNLLVNLAECRTLVEDLVAGFEQEFKDTTATNSAMGAALLAGLKLVGPSGGRISVFQTRLPNIGPGLLQSREDPNERAGKKVLNLGPATDFYKKFALDCSAQQVAVDIFMMNGQYADLSSIACACKYSGGSLFYFPGLHATENLGEVDRFDGALRRYMTRKIGFEAVMRIRCTRGINIHTFHGNFFVRSTDLLSLPNVNPDAGFAMQMSLEDTLDANIVCFQAALLYTSSKGERRIRVHTLAVPVTNQLSDVYDGADIHGITSLISKMAADKSVNSLSDARDGLINCCVDMLGAYKNCLHESQRSSGLFAPVSLQHMPLYSLAMLKFVAFRVGTSTRLDDRLNALEQCKNLPTCYFLQLILPDLYPIHGLQDCEVINVGGLVVPQPGRLPLCSAYLDQHGVYLLDNGLHMILWVGAAVSDNFCQQVLQASCFRDVVDGMVGLPDLDNSFSECVRNFVCHLNDSRSMTSDLRVVREDSKARHLFANYLVEDRSESTMSYPEFLQHLLKEVKS